MHSTTSTDWKRDMHPGLTDLQNSFAGALVDPEHAIPADLIAGSRNAHRFDVHRNNMVVGLTEILADHFPVCRRIVGDDFFAAMARAFVARHKPASPMLMTYGDELPVFIEEFHPAREVPYLADVARVERAWRRAYHCVEQVSLPLETITLLSAQDLMAARLALHPSLQLVPSRYPIATIWTAHQPGNEPAEMQDIRAENALVLRSDTEVAVRGLSTGAATFISSIGRDTPTGEAAALALAGFRDFDFGNSLVDLFGSGAVVGLSSPSAVLGTSAGGKSHG